MQLTQISEVFQRVLTLFETRSADEALRAVLEIACSNLGSTSGMVALLEEDGHLVSPAVLGDDWREYRVEESRWKFPPEEWGWLPWAELSSELSHRDNRQYRLFGSSQCPPHRRSLLVRLVRDRRLEGLLYVGDTAEEITDEQQTAIEALAAVAAAGLPVRQPSVTGGAPRSQLVGAEHVTDCDASAAATEALPEQLDGPRSHTSARQLLGTVQQTLQIIDNTQAVIYVKDLRGRYLLINRQFEDLFGVTRDRILGQTDFDVFPEHLAHQFRRNDVHVAESGEVLKCDEIAPHADGPHTYLSVKVPLRDPQGQVYAVAGISTDITDRVRFEHQMHEYGQRLELILNSIDEGLFGVDQEGLVTFVNPAASRLLGWAPDELIGKPQHVIVTVDGQLRESARLADSPVYKILRDGRPRRVKLASFWRRDGSRLPVEYHCAPINDTHGVSGAVVSFHDLREQLKQREIERELQAAEAVQRQLYPARGPVVSGFDIAGAAFPADQACGDYFDFITTDDGRIHVVVGDVSGHGLGPALHMVETRAYLRLMLRAEPSLPEPLTRLNRLLETDLPDGSFVSLFLGRIEPETRSFQYASAGHPGVLMNRNGDVRLLEATGSLLGLMPETQIGFADPISLEPGDILLLPTDGLMETTGPDFELFGWQRMLDITCRNRQESADTIIQKLFDNSRSFANGDRQRDDITLVVVKVSESA